MKTKTIMKQQKKWDQMITLKTTSDKTKKNKKTTQKQDDLQ